MLDKLVRRLVVLDGTVWIGGEQAPVPDADGSDLPEREEWELVSPQVPDGAPELESD